MLAGTSAAAATEGAGHADRTFSAAHTRAVQRGDTRAATPLQPPEPPVLGVGTPGSDTPPVVASAMPAPPGDAGSTAAVAPDRPGDAASAPPGRPRAGTTELAREDALDDVRCATRSGCNRVFMDLHCVQAQPLNLAPDSEWGQYTQDDSLREMILKVGPVQSRRWPWLARDGSVAWLLRRTLIARTLACTSSRANA